MTIKSLALIAYSLSFLSLTAHALESWQGTKFLYSTSSQLEYASKVELGQNQGGFLVSKEGSSAITFQEFNESLEITPTGEIRFLKYPFVFIEEIGMAEQVEMTSKLKRIVLTGSPNFVEVNEIWEECFSYQTNGQSVQKCETNTLRHQEMVLKDRLSSVGMGAQANDSVVLPAPGTGSIFVNLNADMSATLLSSGNAFEGNNTRSWKLEGDNLVLTLVDGATITYSAIQNLESVTRVVGLYKKGGAEQMIIGALVIDKKISIENLSRADVEGKYRTVLVSTLSEVDTLYTFSSNGFGGFESHILGDKSEIVWAWDLKNGLIEASRYLHSDGSEAKTKVEVLACLFAGSDCTVSSTRSYRIISKTGNRYTMLRTLSIKRDQQEEKELTVWVFYKQ